MTIAKRLLLFVLIALITLLAVVGSNFYQIQQIHGALGHIGGRIVPSIRTQADILTEIGEYRRELTNFNQAKGPEQQAVVLARLEPHAQAVERSFTAYSKLVKNAHDAQLLEQEQTLW